jgi:hypothetical protein
MYGDGPTDAGTGAGNDGGSGIEYYLTTWC